MGALTLTAPTQAAEGAVVRGTAFPAGSGLAHVGCEQVFGAGSAPQPYVDRGPGKAPLGARSLGFDLGGGDAAGPVRYLSSMATTTTASLAAFAPTGTSGVAWVGYVDPAGAVWFGRAPISVPAGGWTTVQASGLAFEWAQYDMATGRVVADGPTQGVADFAAAHGGDGAGLWALTLGCDGRPFQIDAFSVGDAAGTATYDFEGLATTLSITSSATSVVAGGKVRIDGALGVTGEATIPHATAVLERRTPETDGWESVRVVDADGALTTTVEPPTSGDYRWRFADRPLAEASTSPVMTVGVARDVEAQPTEDDRRVRGSVAPYRAGIPVTVRPADGTGPTRRATTDAQGEFAVDVADLPRGAYVASTPATSANLRGVSAEFRLTGSGPAPETGGTDSPDSATQNPATRSPETRAPRTPQTPEQPQQPQQPREPQSEEPTRLESSESPRPEPRPEPTREPRPEPTREPKPEPTREPQAPAGPQAPSPSGAPEPEGTPTSQAPSPTPSAEPTPSAGPPEPVSGS